MREEIFNQDIGFCISIKLSYPFKETTETWNSSLGCHLHEVCISVANLESEPIYNGLLFLKRLLDFLTFYLIFPLEAENASAPASV